MRLYDELLPNLNRAVDDLLLKQLDPVAPRSAVGRTASKARCSGGPAAGRSRTAQHVLQVGSEHKAGLSWGTRGWATSLGSLAVVQTAGTSPGNRSSTEPLPGDHIAALLTHHPRRQGWLTGGDDPAAGGTVDLDRLRRRLASAGHPQG
jgi:hypothetical protein